MDKANKAFYVLVTVAGIILLICITIIIVLFLKTHIIIEGETIESFFTEFIVAFTGLLSALLVYLGFKQQSKQMKIANDDKAYDRCMKLIDDMVLLLNKVSLTVQRPNSIVTPLAEDAIDTYLAYLNMDIKLRPILIDKVDFDRSLYLYLSNVGFVYSNIEKLKMNNKEYYDLLTTKMIFTIPTIYVHIMELIKHEKQINIPDDDNKDGKYLYMTIQELHAHFEIMKKEDNIH